MAHFPTNVPDIKQCRKYDFNNVKSNEQNDKTIYDNPSAYNACFYIWEAELREFWHFVQVPLFANKIINLKLHYLLVVTKAHLNFFMVMLWHSQHLVKV